MKSEQRRPPIRPIKTLGTTWYDRGTAYWARRLYFLLYALIGLAFAVAIVGGFIFFVVGHLASDTLPAVVALAISVPAILASLFYGLKPLKRSPEAKALGRPMSYENQLSRRQRIAAGAGAGATGYAASAGSGAAGGAIFFAAFVFLGQCVGSVIVGCQKYLTIEEFEAVQEANRWIERHHE
ncbi:hypothetical protein GTV32_16350 [Gordonia sp. SID5947]|uniref:protein BatD n=1 Tax=Gordonia sp. SID5947 TaxID=2690315 RepID=UPI00136890D2|nr:protein BatD [Gordonia sp. SID5947]MYR07774.1 hypothetical protein [Gordonia sp. SID5947]